MPRVDRSTNILTGMIIAALYVILLVGFVRESYMHRDAARNAQGAGGWAAMRDVANRACRTEPQPLCKANEAALPSKLPAIWSAMRDDP
jgi:hypothetical protein